MKKLLFTVAIGLAVASCSSSRSLNSEISSALSPKEIRVFGLYLDGLSYKEIAEKLDVTEKSVDNAMFRIRKKLKDIVK